MASSAWLLIFLSHDMYTADMCQKITHNKNYAQESSLLMGQQVWPLSQDI